MTARNTKKRKKNKKKKKWNTIANFVLDLFFRKS